MTIDLKSDPPLQSPRDTQLAFDEPVQQAVARPVRVLRMAQTIEITGLKEATIYKLHQKGEFRVTWTRSKGESPLSTGSDQRSAIGRPRSSSSRDIVEHAIARKLKDKAEAAYQRGELLMKRAVIMKRWRAFCSTPDFVAPDQVTGMGRAA